MGAVIVRSPYEMMQNVPREQPVAFSHEHHAGGLGIDCRYCHNTVEMSSFANIPPTKVCMNCHREMWAASPELTPVRESYRTGRSIEWTGVHELPEYVYFDHSVHVHGGIACSSYHGLVNDEPGIRELISVMLQEAGFLTLSACGASEALELSGDRSNRTDLLIIDVELKDGDGIGLAEQIVERRENLPVLIMSGHIDNKDRATRKKYPFLPKPFVLHQLFDAVDQIVSRVA
jgi:CheY-like chemotaxis protein